MISVPLGLSRACDQRPRAGSHRWRTSSIIFVSDRFLISALAVLAVPLLDGRELRYREDQGRNTSEAGAGPWTLNSGVAS